MSERIARKLYCDLCGTEKSIPREICPCGDIFTTDGRTWYQIRIRTIIGVILNFALLYAVGYHTDWWIISSIEWISGTMLVLLHTLLATWIICEFDWL